MMRTGSPSAMGELSHRLLPSALMAGKLDTPLGISAEHPSFKPGNAGKARTFPHNSGSVNPFLG